jgi:hypothetical protein
MLTYYSDPTNPSRTWEYQTCSEWGFYQTCNTGSSCPYTQGLHTVDVDLTLCATAFNLSAASVYTSIERAQVQYGGSNIQTSRTIFASGEIDPWQANSVLKAPNSEENGLILYVEGASHHFWTHEVLPTDSVEVNNARVFIWDTVTNWLAEAAQEQQQQK